MLKLFLQDLARSRFEWGRHDCALVLADWWLLNHGGEDPAAELRGAYSNEDECAALLARTGHLPRLVARLARRVGALRTTDPQPGDFAVIRHRDLWFGAILSTSGFWHIKAHDGAAALRSVRVVAAWSIACPQSS
jgi:hypothetical protein